MTYKFTFTILLFLLKLSSTIAQLTELPINFSSHSANTRRNTLVESDTINLPFWDDFSNVRYTVDSTIWLHGKDVFVSNSRSYLPPSYNVAIFDAFDGNGNAYSTNILAKGLADSLVSKRIDLSSYTTSSNVFLSFFWQESVGEQAPDGDDYLILSFRNSDNEWEEVFRQNGSGYSSDTLVLFNQVFKAINQNRFLHSGFQFKFQLFSNLAGDFDVFSVDYIYLNEGNTPVNTQNNAYDSYEDRTFSKEPGTIFSNYYAVPLKHLTEEWLSEKIQSTTVIYNNLWAGNANNPLFATEIFGILTDTLKQNQIIDSAQINGNFLTQNQDTAQFTAQVRNKEQLITYLLSEKETEDSVYLELQLNLGTTDSLFFETINGTTVYYPDLSFRRNDTVSTIYPLHNFYAQDDGTAESSILLNSKNYLLAQEFDIIGENYMTAIDIYIPNLGQNAGTKNITLLVWDELTNSETNILAAQNVLANPAQGTNQFQRFILERPVYVGGKIFIGYREENDEPVSIGFDKNSNSATNLFYNQSGTWEANTFFQGSVMIRPVFDRANVTVANKPKQQTPEFFLYPNPSKGSLKYDGSFDSIEIYALNGQRLMHKAGNDSSKSIDISHLKDGIYFVKIINQSTVSTQKIILKR
ncbi:hypothetical protein GCM10011506_13760 [Marivirga lumbricoides]|uniref:Secretion system C-terminal sorting domain-containing protein n=1 Tax=Marivirga lumbricoides TaxID=1046115 RepID=A0A2T4DQM3_9BACT|nr:hypothetical protein C9994_09145 [Marivirga lumbricoides]GGC29610.1 hypothetical protein GCM10011506_13760 [Marivirga lumbricoides]